MVKILPIDKNDHTQRRWLGWIHEYEFPPLIIIPASPETQTTGKKLEII